MNRRAFFGVALAGAAGLVLDPERLLWVPGQRTYFLPSTTLFRPDWAVRAWWASPDNSTAKVLRVEAMPSPHADWAMYGTAVRNKHPQLDAAKQRNLALSMVEHAQREYPLVSVAGLESMILAATQAAV